jgi:hypothetical protein
LLLRYSCFFKPWTLIPLTLSAFGWHFFPNVCPLAIPLTNLSLVWFFLTICPLRCAAPAWWVILLQEAANFFRDLLFPQVLSSGFWRHCG